MELPSTLLNSIVEKLKKISPYRIILFGSFADGYQNRANDIDIAVVLNSEKAPKTFEERMENAILVEELLLDISEQFPLDITVYTKPEYVKINDGKSSFSRELKLGTVLYDLAS